MKHSKFYDRTYYLLLLKNLQKNSETGVSWGCGCLFFVILFFLAVGLPCCSLFQDLSRGREYEGRYGVGTLNRSQQAYHFDNGTFSPNLTQSQLQTKNDLGVIIPESEYYDFVNETTPTVAYALAIPKNPQQDGVRSYSGATFFEKEEKAYQQITCQSNEIIEKPSKPLLKDGILICPENMLETY